MEQYSVRRALAVSAAAAALLTTPLAAASPASAVTRAPVSVTAPGHLQPERGAPERAAGQEALSPAEENHTCWYVAGGIALALAAAGWVARELVRRNR
ncbi:hypothetical protein ABT160_16250 [Streptomyces sp. NPDC001941]|uniref:hypothetical protein n=1 Tax=Streptomyces sp. NPDC001941 TaxID=3154659 RepID=UPI00332C5881